MAEPDRNFIFTFSTGRSGTAYLAKLLAANLPAAEIHHERTGYQSFGVDTPDASHFTLFNSVGNVAKVQEFWAQKLVRIGRTQKRFYGEASHFNAKAGLLENIHRLADQGKTHIVFLDRDPFKILWSYHNRFDFANVGFTWLFSLDPNYPNKIVPSDDHKKYGQAGIAYWYIQEMLARGEYYRHLLANAPSVTLHHWDLADITQQAGADKLIGALTVTAQSATIPAPENTSQRWFFGEKVRSKLQEMTALLERDCAKLGEDFFKSGRRLATPKRTRRAVRAQNITINAGRTARPRVPRATTEKAIKDAVGLVHQNKFAQAQKMLEDALAGAPNDPDVHCQLGLVHARRG
ncbi:MAG TPA: hypothetical protein DCS82_10600, partial [Rhodospirillaceae bacterium]|nr:hypothetical protein [Rhodospirillaceae bacterium]